MKIFGLKEDAKGWVAAVLCGALLTLAFPRPGLWWLGWFALTPLLAVIKGISPGKGFRLGFTAGLVHFLSLFYWLVYTMQTYGGLPLYLAAPVLFLLCAYMSIYLGAFAALLTFWSRSAWGLFTFSPLLWVALEYARGLFFSGLPWCFLGYSQVDRLHIIQISDIFGVYGVSFLMVAANAAIFVAARSISVGKAGDAFKETKTALKIFAVFAGMLGAAITYGSFKISSIEEQIAGAEYKKIAVVQGNIDQAVKWAPEFQESSTKKYIALSHSAKDKIPELVIWPETATPFYFLYEKELSRLVLKAAKDMGTDFLIGSPSFKSSEDGLEYYNSAYLITPAPEVAGKYDKVHLVPFGEYVPFKKWLPFLGKMVAQVGDFKPGKKGDVIFWDRKKIGMLICYEIIFPELACAMAENGADFLVNITNDAWFAKTSAPYQHFNMAVFRAVENRKPLVRTANTGISGFIDPAGKVSVQSELFEEAVLTHEIPIIMEKSLYTRVGDLFAKACTAASFMVIFIAISKKGVRQKRD